ncbi:MAG: hypothetical protein IKP28_02345 [Clostridia bacterium]|nr:hypothetical protein [Clostridia bacterium]
MRKAITVVILIILLFEFSLNNRVMATSMEAFNEINEGYTSYTDTKRGRCKRSNSS